MSRNTIIFICMLAAFSYPRPAHAGCTGVCLSLDSSSTGYVTDLVDTAYLTPGGNVKIFATYNEACHMIMESQMRLVWVKDGLPYDTTDISDATFDNIWTYYTSYFIYEPGLYEIYFLGFYQPGYSCKKILVLKENNTVTENPSANLEEIKENEDPILVYPNPSYDGVIYIHSKRSISEVELFDMNGIKVLDITVEKNNLFTLNTSTYKKGLYLLRICNNRNVDSRKIVLN